jgi:hypothetical protein
MIAPVLALAAWTFVMWVWLYAVRIPAMRKAKIDVQKAELQGPGAITQLPRAAQRPAENYNHLHEQPTVFYAIALAAQIAGAAEPIAIGLAWTYVALRIVHSLIQATANIIMARFLIFMVATLVLIALLVRVAWSVFL